jgi:hypothetical protein
LRIVIALLLVCGAVLRSKAFLLVFRKILDGRSFPGREKGRAQLNDRTLKHWRRGLFVLGRRGFAGGLALDAGRARRRNTGVVRVGYFFIESAPKGGAADAEVGGNVLVRLVVFD